MSIYRKFYRFGEEKGDYTFVLNTLFFPIRKKPYFINQKCYKVGTKEEKQLRDDYIKQLKKGKTWA